MVDAFEQTVSRTKVCFHNNELNACRCVDNFIVEQQQRPLMQTKAMKSYINARRCKSLAKNGKYKIDQSHQFMVHLVGLIGKLPKSEDLKKTVGEHYDLLSAFQTFFLYQGEIYQLTTFS